MHNFQQKFSIFDFITCALRAQINISQFLFVYFLNNVLKTLVSIILFYFIFIMFGREKTTTM